MWEACGVSILASIVTEAIKGSGGKTLQLWQRVWTAARGMPARDQIQRALVFAACAGFATVLGAYEAAAGWRRSWEERRFSWRARSVLTAARLRRLRQGQLGAEEYRHLLELGRAGLTARAEPADDPDADPAARWQEAEGLAWELFKRLIEAEPPEPFRRVFFGEAEGSTGWSAAFQVHFAGELSSNPALREAFTGTVLEEVREATLDLPELRAGLLSWIDGLDVFRQRLDAVDSAVAEQARHVRRENELDGRTLLFDPRAHSSEGEIGERFTFRGALDELVGREDDFARLEEGFLRLPAESEFEASEAARFQWLILAGSAGTGKSRFAMELLPRVTDWSLRGFVEEDAIDANHAHRWPIEDPTLLIVDYAARRPQIRAFVQRLAGRAKDGDLAFPVRLLLVERRHDEPSLRAIEEDGDRRDCARVSKAGPPHLLSPLSREELVRLMRSRLTSSREGSVAPTSDEELLDTLEIYDEQKRPLFAAIVADAIARGYLPLETGGGSSEQARRTLFDRLLDREKRRIWGHGESTEDLVPYENLLVLSTFTSGLSVQDYAELGADPDALALELPPAGKLNPRLYTRLTMASKPWREGEERGVEGGARNRRLSFLEPDLLGERLVLRTLLRDEDHDDPASLFPGRRSAHLRHLAWRLAGREVAHFVQQCYDNYPDDVVRLGWLLPPEEPVDPAVMAALARNLMFGISRDCVDRGPDAAAVERILDLLARLDAAMDGPALEASTTSDAASAFAQGAQALARVVNPAVKIKLFGLSALLPPTPKSRLQSLAESFAEPARAGREEPPG